MLKVRLNIGKAKASKSWQGFIPKPKLKLLDHVSEVMRFKHYSPRTETTYRQWIKRYILVHGKRHPREMGAAEVMRLKHYSIRTERTYCEWLRRYVHFHRLRTRDAMLPAESQIEAFLSELAEPLA